MYISFYEWYSEAGIMHIFKTTYHSRCFLTMKKGHIKYVTSKPVIKLLQIKQSISEVYSKYNAKRRNVWHIQYSIKNY
jgi:hypothetical protein